MTDNRVNQPTRGPRHLYDTGKFRTLPPELRVRPKKFAEASEGEAKPVNPHVAADGSKVHSWPLAKAAVDPNPTGRFAAPTPRPHVPHAKVVIDPPMTQAGAFSVRNICMALAGAAALVALVLAVVAVVNP